MRAHVTGSAEVSTTTPYGVGIAGGSDDRAVDGTETMDFAFDFPATMLMLHIGTIINVDLDAVLWELTVEAFDPAGTSLGIQDAPTQPHWNLTSMYGDALIGRVRIRGNPDGVIVRLLDVTYQCD